jgi:hypothetical protein
VFKDLAEDLGKGRLLRVGWIYVSTCRGRQCSEALVFVGFWFGKHVDAGQRRLYFLPLGVSWCLCGSIPSDRWVGGSNMRNTI